jgi:hypothetical protein
MLGGTMSFDVNELTRFAEHAVRDFAKKHSDEDFYAFAIDASLLCLNSEQKFKETLEGYQKHSPGLYSTDEDIDSLKQNTGDWEYQGFSDFSECRGFDSELYDEHYNLGLDLEEGDPELDRTEYALAMNELIRRLKNSNAFDVLRRTSNFVISRVEHNY